MVATTANGQQRRPRTTAMRQAFSTRAMSSSAKQNRNGVACVSAFHDPRLVVMFGFPDQLA